MYVDPHEHGARLHLHYGDLSDPGILTEIMHSIAPQEIYHLGAQSHVRVSFDMPEYTGDITALGTTRVLEAIRRSGIKTKFYQASSSELYGSAPAPQHELTPFMPQSPYAAAKLYAYWMTVNYRNAYSMYACNGILFNHESPRRGEIFVTRKITRGIASIVSGSQQTLYIGNLDALRDWGFAPEYYVVGTGSCHSVRDFIETACDYIGIEIEWKGAGVQEKAYAKNAIGAIQSGQCIIEVDPRYFRPTEVDKLQADISKAKKQLGWEPIITFKELVQIMMDHDLAANGIDAPGYGNQAVKQKGFNWTSHAFATSIEQSAREIG
jgi:GDPmannose 4,6-dehydratase